MSEQSVNFSLHALQRARERKLWKYVSKAKFWFDASYRQPNQVQLERCVYCYKTFTDKIIITTMYSVI